MPPKDIPTHLMGLIKKSHRLELEYLDFVSEGERHATGTLEQWAPKDRISHITYWRRRVVESLSYLSRGQNPPEYPGYEECNRQNFEETKDQSIQALLREADQVLSAFPLVLARFSEEDFRNPDYHPHLKDSTLLAYAINYGYIHPLYHLTEAYLKLGNINRVNQLQDKMVEDVTGIDDSPWSFGTVYYDRACFYTLTGEREQALEFLAKSFSLHPDLIKWARDDDDLVSLREDPGFQALLNSLNRPTED
jgi:tetratricopeptide (TPR) repeat protein